MNWLERFNRFDFDNQPAFDQQIDPVATVEPQAAGPEWRPVFLF